MSLPKKTHPFTYLKTWSLLLLFIILLKSHYSLPPAYIFSVITTASSFFFKQSLMGRHSCCVKQKLRKGLWSPEEDDKLLKYITRFGVGCWSSVPKHAGFYLFLFSSVSGVVFWCELQGKRPVLVIYTCLLQIKPKVFLFIDFELQ